jgi:hypothetical protein
MSGIIIANLIILSSERFLVAVRFGAGKGKAR